MKNKTDILIAGIILLIALSFRLYKIDTPLADFHSWRQADTAAVARNFVNDGFNLLRPTYDDLSNIQSGYENPEGLRMVEFPIYSALMAGVYKIAPYHPIELYGRAISVFFSLVIIAIIYYLTLKEYHRTAAIFASLTYAIMPFFVFFSRVVLPETTALAFTFIAILLVYLSAEKEERVSYYLLLLFSAISFSLALLIKPTVIFYGLPLFVIFWYKFKLKLFKHIPFYIYFLISFIPLILWRVYIQQFPEGIPASSWLITSVNTYQGLQIIFFRPAFFRWIFFERINSIILGGYILSLFIVGSLVKVKRLFLHSILASAVIYLFTFQGGNVQHEYYQTLILPALSIFIGVGASHLTQSKKLLPKAIIYPALIVLFTLSFFFTYYRVKDYYSYPGDLPRIGNIIQTITSENDKIVTDSMGDTTLLYLSNRKGAPANYKTYPELKELGYNYFVTQNGTTINQLKEEGEYDLIFENDKFAMFRL